MQGRIGSLLWRTLPRALALSVGVMSIKASSQYRANCEGASRSKIAPPAPSATSERPKPVVPSEPRDDFLHSGALGVIGGSSFLESEFLRDFEPICVNTHYGSVIVLANADKTTFFVQRHGCDPECEYRQPHLINQRAIVAALQQLGCTKVIGFGSVGSLKKSIKIGTLVIPDDYLSLWDHVSFFTDKRSHLAPGFNDPLRDAVLNMLTTNGYEHAVDRGVYAQTTGPRFETVAEINLLSTFGDVVGMTCGHEATLTKELNIPYCLISMVDNMANGLDKKTALSYEAFRAGVKRNEATMANVLGLVLTNFAPKNNSTKQ